MKKSVIVVAAVVFVLGATVVGSQLTSQKPTTVPLVIVQGHIDACHAPIEHAAVRSQNLAFNEVPQPTPKPETSAEKISRERRCVTVDKELFRYVD